MAKKQASDDGLGPSAVPGIRKPFIIAEAGHEGARAAYELANMAEGRITASDSPADKFVDYDESLKQA